MPRGDPGEDARKRKMATTTELKLCPGCDGLLSCASDCPGYAVSYEESEQAYRDWLKEQEEEAELRKMLREMKKEGWTPPDENPYGECDCEEYPEDVTCNACLWQERLEAGELSNQAAIRNNGCPECLRFGEECEGCYRSNEKDYAHGYDQYDD